MKPSLSLLPSVLFVWLALSLVTFAQEARVRASLDPAEELWTGQRIPFEVELLAPGFFSGTAAFDLPEPPGMILLPPVGRPVVSTREIDGVSFTVQRHVLAVFSRRAGDCVIPAFPVRFSFKRQPLDKEIIAVTGKTEALTFPVKQPPGAEQASGVISARGLTVKEIWTPEPGSAKPGDAFTRTVTFTAPEFSAMAFPPFPAGEIDGLGIYSKPPEVLDHVERGSLTGKRRDSITYVCERAGRFTIPAVRLTWFDLEARKLRTIDFPARVLEVAPDPALLGADTDRSTPVPGEAFTSLVLSVLICAALAVCAFIATIPRVRKIAKNAFSNFQPVRLAPLHPSSTPPNTNQPDL